MQDALDTPLEEAPRPLEPADPATLVVSLAREPARFDVDKKRLAEQLEALKRKEVELRRAIAIADHPELADAIRLLDGRAYALTRAEAKIAQGLSKSEERRKETLEKKLDVLREKNAELNAQIAELSKEHDGLVLARATALEGERRAALQELVATLGEHAAALAKAGLDAAELVPEIGQRMAEIRALAEELVAARIAAP